MQKKKLNKIVIIVSALVIGSLLLYLIFDEGKNKQPPGTNIALSTPSKDGALDNPILFFMEKSADGKCIAKQRDLSKETEITVLSQLVCPDNIIWDYQHQKFLLIVGKNLWVQDMSESKPVNLGELPFQDVPLIWIDDTTGNIRLGYLVPILPQNVVTTEQNNIKQVFFKFEDKSLPATYLPETGLPYVAIISELKKGKWEKVAIEPTKSGAPNTPGLAVLESRTMQSKKPISLKDLLVESTCAGKLNCSSDFINVSVLVGKKDAYGFIPSRYDIATAFGVIITDNIGHAVEPVYFCTKNCTEGARLEGLPENERLSLATKKDEYLLITEELTGKHPRVYKAGEGKPILDLPNAFAAVWLP